MNRYFRHIIAFSLGLGTLVAICAMVAIIWGGDDSTEIGRWGEFMLTGVLSGISYLTASTLLVLLSLVNPSRVPPLLSLQFVAVLTLPSCYLVSSALGGLSWGLVFVLAGVPPFLVTAAIGGAMASWLGGQGEGTYPSIFHR